jgi:dihydropteroate synthase
MLSLEHLAEILETHRETAGARVRPLDLAGRSICAGERPAIIGVVNLSPGSWYRESVCLSTETAVRRARVLQAQGADIVDLGAESTLAHTDRVGAEAQAGRLLPVIRELTGSELILSVETYEPVTARACLEAGARVLNLTGIRHNEELYRLAAAYQAGVILCYVQGENVREVGDFQFAADIIGEMETWFRREIDSARKAGVENIILDPGLGFYYRNLQDSSLRVRHQMNVFLQTFRLRTLGYPVCHALPHAFEFFGEEVRCAEPFFAVLAALGKTDLFRTHEVPRVKAVLDALQAF